MEQGSVIQTDDGSRRDMLNRTLDPDFYRRLYPDLAALDAAGAERHYREFGIQEGRQGCAEGVREGFITLIPSEGPVLEIGPFAAPSVAGPNVCYADVLSTEQLQARAVELGLDASRCPEIRYALPTLDLGTISETFVAVVSSHCFEHQPDLVRHLQAVETLLRPGGCYFLLVPDKRFCFDHFLPETSIADVMTAYRRRALVHEIGSVIEHWALTTHNDNSRHWDGDHGAPWIESTREPLIRAIATVEADPDRYIDVHAWQFTPNSFAALTGLIHELGLTRLRPVAVYPTVRPRNEFCAILELSGEVSTTPG